MIFNFLITAIFGLITAIFSILPAAPATPTAVVSAGEWIVTTINDTVSVIQMIYTPTLFAAIMVVVIGMFTFDWIYHTVMWIIRKIPMISIT